jgi:hypothetical protein
MLSFFTSLTTTKDKFNIWLHSDAHQAAHIGSLQLAVEQMDLQPWDISVGLGDWFASIGQEQQGIDIVSELDNFTNHNISDVYRIGGNHDQTPESDPNGSDYYFKKYIDPLGDNPATSKVITANRPYPITGNYDSYHLEIGNMIIIMLGDRNDGPPPMGRDGLDTSLSSRRASGGISTAQWNWFTNLVETNTDKIIIVCSHQAIKDTIIGSGFDEFFPAYNRDENYSYPSELHGDVDEAKRAGYIAYIEGVQSESTIDTWLTTNGQYIDMWFCGHYHEKINETWNGRGRYAQKYGTHFLDISSINWGYHIFYEEIPSKSYLANIQSNQLNLRCYIHEDKEAVYSVGFYDPYNLTISLKTEFVK